jgi:DNA-binding transcriptional LysR family regulator
VTLTQLEYFLAALRSGSFSAAAQRLHVAQPSLSEQVARLERDLGVSLFLRGSRGLRLTEAGRRLQPEAERILLAVGEARVAVEEIRDLESGAVAFGAFSSAHHYLLSDLVAEFRARYPKVAVRVLAYNSTEIARSVREGDLEAGLVALPIDDRGLRLSRTVWECEAAYFSTDPSTLTRPMDVRYLSSAPLILPEAEAGNSDPTRRQLNERAQKIGLTLAPDIEVESPEAALEIAALGVGGTVTSLPLAKILGYTDRMGHVTFADPLRETYAFVTRDTAYLSPATKAILTMAGARMRRLYTELGHSS